MTGMAEPAGIDPDGDDPGRCGTCGRGEPVAQIQFCWAWKVKLCADCRIRRAERELSATARANAAARLRDPRRPGAGQDSQVRGA